MIAADPFGQRREAWAEFQAVTFLRHGEEDLLVWAGPPCPLYALLLAVGDTPGFLADMRGKSLLFRAFGQWHAVPLAQCTDPSTGFLGDMLRGQQARAVAKLVLDVDTRLELDTSIQGDGHVQQQVH